MRHKKSSFASQFTKYGAGVVVVLFVLASLTQNTYKTREELRRAAEPIQGNVVINFSIPKGRYLVRNLATDKNMAGGNEVGFQTFRLPVGDYEVTFGEVFGYSTPLSQRIAVAPNRTVVVMGSYKAIPGTPILNIKVTPEEARYRIFNADHQMIKEGRGSQSFFLPAGDYWVEFSELPGLRAPDRTAFLMRRCMATTVEGVYQPLP